MTVQGAPLEQHAQRGRTSISQFDTAAASILSVFTFYTRREFTGNTRALAGGALVPHTRSSNSRSSTMKYAKTIELRRMLEYNVYLHPEPIGWSKVLCECIAGASSLFQSRKSKRPWVFFTFCPIFKQKHAPRGESI